MFLEVLETKPVSLDLPLCPLTPGAATRRLVKVSSISTESSDDFEERDPGKADLGGQVSLQGQEGGPDSPDSLLADLGDWMENGLGSPFRKWTLSTAAQTHRLRRLRGPAKCRECEAFMVSGTECEEV